MPSGNSLWGYLIPASLVFLFILFPMMMIMAKNDSRDENEKAKKKGAK